MNWKKVLATLFGIFIGAVVICFLVQWIYPNPLTKGAIWILTVGGPKYLMSKIEWVIGSISAVTGIAAVAKKQINDTKTVAATQINDARQQTSQISNLASDQANQLTDLTTTNKTLQEQNNLLIQNKSEAEQKASTLTTENEGLLRENNNLTQALKDLKVATATVTEYK